MKKIEVIGLGAGDIDQLPLGIYEKIIQNEKPLFVRTNDHPVMQSLKSKDVAYTTFDDIYERYDSFAEVYDAIVTKLKKEAEANTAIIYAVPGHPLMAEKTVQLLLDETDVEVDIIGGQSFLDPLFARLKIDPIEGFQLLDATSFTREQIRYEEHLIFAQVYDHFIASEVKLVLLEDLPEDYPVTVVEAVGSQLEKIRTIPLVDLDREVEVSNLTTLYIPPVDPQLLDHTFSYLREVIRILRSEEGCPWDREQTHESLRKYALEEVYELIAAIHAEDDEAIIEELGDVLLQVMLHSQIGEDAGYFTIEDVMKGLSKKMIHRHPHVFAGEALDEDGARQRWEELKAEEKPIANERDSVLARVNRAAPALSLAGELQKKASTVGFDWDSVEGVWEKLTEELAECKEAISQDDKKHIEEEFGDVFFVLAHIAQWYDIHPEVALSRANEKFIQRFSYIEKRAQQAGKELHLLDETTFESYWQAAKEEE